MAKMWWRKQKTLAMLNNRRQFEREFNPDFSSAVEIEIEQGNSYIISETSTSSLPEYIITE
tara:strand:+ start:304 stop:486 length:183 start_codon:yes stop_codon:yes gene_type:complete